MNVVRYDTDQPAIHKKQDWTGTKLGQATILACVGYKPYSNQNLSIWKMRCDCGAEWEVHYTHAVRGSATRCRGCATKANSGKGHYKYKGSENIPYSFFTHVKHRLVRASKTLDCNLDIDYLETLWQEQLGKCAYTGQELIMDKGWGGIQTASLDRIDSTKGYIKGNVQFVHKDVNLMKQHFEEEYFLSLCKMIVNKRNQL